MENKKKKVQFATRIEPDQMKYLNEMAWRNRTSVSEYVIAMINEDMKKNPNWRDGLDELNED